LQCKTFKALHCFVLALGFTLLTGRSQFKGGCHDFFVPLTGLIDVFC
jgi:hypothetical protein